MVKMNEWKAQKFCKAAIVCMKCTTQCRLKYKQYWNLGEEGMLQLFVWRKCGLSPAVKIQKELLQI